MTQQVARCRISIPSLVAGTDNVSFDVIFEATGSDPTLDFVDSQTPTGLITHFLNDTIGPNHPMGGYLSPDLSRATNAVRLDYTDVTAHLDGSPAGTPFRTDFLTLVASVGGFPLPPQLSAVLAYRRDYGSDLEHGGIVTEKTPESAQDDGAPATHTGASRPRARDRGRMYFGPLCSLTAGPGGGALASTFTADAGPSFNTLFDTQNSTAHNQFNVVQWSRAAASVGAVRHYFLNESFGVVRKRGDVTESRVHPWVQVTP